MNKVSVIIPVYNAEKYLKKCIESVQQQTWSDLEIILVDDHSSDSSGLICDQFAATDNRIKVIHNTVNIGVSSARNIGIAEAHGEFILFVDSDDSIDKSMIQYLIGEGLQTKADLVCCGYLTSTVYGLSKNNYFNEKTIYSKDELFENYSRINLRDTLQLGSVWNKLYKLKIIKDNHVLFDCTVNFGEDILFNLNYFSHCKFICFLPHCLYIYRRCEANSLTSKFRKDYLNLSLTLLDEVDSILENSCKYQESGKKWMEMKYTFIAVDSIELLFHPDCKYSFIQKKNEIRKILHNASIENAFLNYSNEINTQAKFIKLCTKCNANILIYIYFRIKLLLRKNTKLFTIIKKYFNRSNLDG